MTIARGAACLLACFVLLGGCGGGGSASDEPEHDTPSIARRIQGQVSKGPLRGAVVSLYALDGKGDRASDTPLAQATTDDDGGWSVDLDDDTGALLVESSGGSYLDESDPEPDAARKRTVTLGGGEGFRSVLPEGAQSVALTVYSNALLLKARRETVGDEFLAVLENERALARDAYGFDPITTLPADPIAPSAQASAASRSYALALGGAAQALNAIAIAFGHAAPDFGLIDALVSDLSDCVLDGSVNGTPIEVEVDGALEALPASDLAREIMRFRNNNASAYAATPLLVPDAATCARSGAAPDTIAPTFAGVPAAFTVAAEDAHGTPASASAISDLLAAVTALDDRPATPEITSDAPEVFPLGDTRVSFKATDAAGNVAVAFVLVTVADLTPPRITAPPDRLVAQTDALTFVDLGTPAVSDNVSGAAQLSVTSDAPPAFPVGATDVHWRVRDAAGLDASATQTVTVLSTTTDSDGDGLSDGDELGAGTDPARADTDADGVGDGLELRAGSDPTRGAAHVLYVSPDGDDGATGASWAHAKADNAGLGTVPPGLSAAQPTFVLYAPNAPVTASAVWSLALAPPCDHIVLIGSLGPDALEPRLDGVGHPTTTFAVAGGTGVGVEGCTDLRLIALAITGATESGVRVHAGSTSLDEVHLFENASSTTGGGLDARDARVSVRASIVAGNHADAGGGLAVHGGTITLEDSTISGNLAQTAGGGIGLAALGADSRVSDCLIVANGAAQGGGAALDDIDGSALGNLTFAWNEARDADGGAGLAYAGAGDGPRVKDSVFAGNRAAANVLESAQGLTAPMSGFNLLEQAPVGAGDIDVSIGGAGLAAGYYLDQSSSPGVDSGSRTAAAAGLGNRYTDPAPSPHTDAGTVDRGYHHATAHVAADDFAIDQPMDTLIEPGASVRVTPLRNGLPLGPGHEVIVSLGLDLVELTSSANVDPLQNGRSAVLGDLGTGAYVFAFGTPLAVGETTLYVRIDGVTLAHTLDVIVKSCDGPPDSCQRPHDMMLSRTPSGDGEGDDDYAQRNDGPGDGD